jgi:hypothetical protein
MPLPSGAAYVDKGKLVVLDSHLTTAVKPDGVLPGCAKGEQIAAKVPNPGRPPTGKDFHDAKGCGALASHALRPKASRRNLEGV